MLAIVAEPPEINPGQQVTLSLVVAGATDYSATFAACAAFDSFIGGGAQYGEGDDDDGCAARGLCARRGQGGRAAGGVRPGAVRELRARDADPGRLVAGRNRRRIRDSVGLPFLIEANVVADGKAIRAVKRVLISERATPHENPPAPRFTLGEIEIEPDPSRPLGCRAAKTSPLDSHAMQ